MVHRQHRYSQFIIFPSVCHLDRSQIRCLRRQISPITSPFFIKTEQLKMTTSMHKVEMPSSRNSFWSISLVPLLSQSSICVQWMLLLSKPSYMAKPCMAPNKVGTSYSKVINEFLSTKKMIMPSYRSRRRRDRNHFFPMVGAGKLLRWVHGDHL